MKQTFHELIQTHAAPMTWWRYLRAGALALALTPIVAYWSTSQIVDIILSLLVPPIGVTMVVALLNRPILRLAPRLALSTGELVLIYAMLAAACAVGAEWMDCIAKQIASYTLFATDSNQFDTLMLPHLSRLLFLHEKEPLKGYAAGGHGWDHLWKDIHIWQRPILGWTFFLLALVVAMVSINSLMRRQWTERERLAFPIIELPCAVADFGGSRRPSSLWQDPALWIAFGLMSLIDLANGISFLIPGAPHLNVRFLGDLNLLFSSPPWNTTGWTPIGLFPFIVALSTFLPTDLCASMVIFYFFRKFQQIVAASMGFPQGLFGGGYLVPSPPYFGEQTWGAFLALFVTAMWSGRNHLRGVARRLRTGGADEGDVPPRWALAGLIAGTAGVVLIGEVVGLPPTFGLVYLLLYLAFSTVISRMRAEVGPPSHEMAWLGPNQLVVDFMGTHGLQAKTIVGMSTTFYLFNRLHRSHPMPHQLEAMKMAEREHVDQRWLVLALLLATVAGCVAALLVRFYLGYRWGAESDGWAQTGVVNDLLNHPRRANLTAVLFVGLGAAFTFGLNALRFQFPGFWLHPVGYALAMNFGVDYYWFGLLVAMALKTLALRSGGLKNYRRLHAAMIGVMAAEFLTETLWAAVAMIYRIPTYSISINGRLGWHQ